jgi:hypothetical protein
MWCVYSVVRAHTWINSAVQCQDLARINIFLLIYFFLLLFLERLVRISACLQNILTGVLIVFLTS